jgi:hypothetical protein
LSNPFTHYILDDENHVVPAELMVWARFMNDTKRRIVKQTDTRFHWVSTVFLGIDYGWGESRMPVVFETMTFAREHKVKEVFGRLMPTLQEADDVEHGFGRYCSWDEALTAHDAIVSRLLRAERAALKLVKAHET